MLLRHVVLDKLKIPNRELHPPFCWQRSIGEALWYNEQFAIHMLRGTSDKSWLRLVAMGSSTSQVIRQIDTVQKKKEERIWRRTRRILTAKVSRGCACFEIDKFYFEVIFKNDLERGISIWSNSNYCWESKRCQLFKFGISKKSWWIRILTGSNKQHNNCVWMKSIYVKICCVFKKILNYHLHIIENKRVHFTRHGLFDNYFKLYFIINDTYI